MHDPYRMVFVSGFFYLILIIGVLTYRFIFHKKRINYFILLLLVSLLPVVSIFRPGVYESGDFNIHIYDTIDFYTILKQGQFMPSWAGDLNATFGYPLFIFLNPLPYYLQSLFHFTGISFIYSFKILLTISYISSGIFFYLWAKREVKNSLAAFSGSVMYLFTPYHLVDLHFRVDIGEVMTFASLSLFFWTLSKFQEEKNILWFLITSLAFTLIMYSHQAMAVFSLIIIVPYILYSYLKSKQYVKKIILSLSTIALGFAYSFYTWLPHIVYPKFTLIHLETQGMVVFPTFAELLYSKWRYGLLFQGHKGELSYLVGYTQIIILIVAIIIVLNKRVKKLIMTPLLLWLSLSAILIFMITPFSYIIWKSVPILITAQFSTRLILLLTFCIAVLTTYVSYSLRKYSSLIILFLLVTVGYTILNWGNRRMIPAITDAQLIANVPSSTSEIEGLGPMAQPKWILPKKKDWMDKIPKSHMEILRGEGEIKQIQRANTIHSYIAFSTNSLLVKENTWYFPGWKLYIDNQPAELGYTKGSDPGIISFTVPSGLHKIDLVYKDITDLFIAKLISVITLLISLLILVFISLKKLSNKSINPR